MTLFFPQGLVVPVIRNVEGMNFADIEKAIGLLGEKVKKNLNIVFVFLLLPFHLGVTPLQM